MFRFLIIASLTLIFSTTHSQTITTDSLNAEIVKMKVDLQQIELNLYQGEKKFKKGILVATIGYATVITGGLMLGRKYDETGKGLLIAGGATGILGTAIMLDSFKYLGKSYRVKNRALRR